MNLHGIVSGAIGTVNPFIAATVKISAGYTVSGSGKQTPAYTTYSDVSMQVQALDSDDLKLLDGINLNGTHRKIYMNGQVDGVIRSTMKGGDIITIASGANAGVWLVTKPLEQWPDWTAVAVTLQNETPE